MNDKNKTALVLGIEPFDWEFGIQKGREIKGHMKYVLNLGCFYIILQLKEKT